MSLLSKQKNRLWNNFSAFVLSSIYAKGRFKWPRVPKYREISSEHMYGWLVFRLAVFELKIVDSCDKFQIDHFQKYLDLRTDAPALNSSTCCSRMSTTFQTLGQEHRKGITRNTVIGKECSSRSFIQEDMTQQVTFVLHMTDNWRICMTRHRLLRDRSEHLFEGKKVL